MTRNGREMFTRGENTLNLTNGVIIFQSTAPATSMQYLMRDRNLFLELDEESDESHLFELNLITGSYRLKKFPATLYKTPYKITVCLRENLCVVRLLAPLRARRRGSNTNGLISLLFKDVDWGVPQRGIDETSLTMYLFNDTQLSLEKAESYNSIPLRNSASSPPTHFISPLSWVSPRGTTTSSTSLESMIMLAVAAARFRSITLTTRPRRGTAASGVLATVDTPRIRTGSSSDGAVSRRGPALALAPASSPDGARPHLHSDHLSLHSDLQGSTSTSTRTHPSLSLRPCMRSRLHSPALGRAAYSMVALARGVERNYAGRGLEAPVGGGRGSRKGARARFCTRARICQGIRPSPAWRSLRVRFTSPLAHVVLLPRSWTLALTLPMDSNSDAPPPLCTTAPRATYALKQTHADSGGTGCDYFSYYLTHLPIPTRRSLRLSQSDSKSKSDSCADCASAPEGEAQCAIVEASPRSPA
ncbi:hypothetical protein K438DRAFT_2101687 [Mycena galopus ATCC 62051]|nr:hypothetical protein K438DRAFT_2101687 [Mycena galopus ATCC 62051]